MRNERSPNSNPETNNGPDPHLVSKLCRRTERQGLLGAAAAPSRYDRRSGHKGRCQRHLPARQLCPSDRRIPLRQGSDLQRRQGGTRGLRCLRHGTLPGRRALRGALGRRYSGRGARRSVDALCLSARPAHRHRHHQSALHFLVSPPDRKIRAGEARHRRPRHDVRAGADFESLRVRRRLPPRSCGFSPSKRGRWWPPAATC